LNLLGLGQKDFSPEDAYALLNGQKTSVLKFSIDDSPEKRKILEKEKVDFKVEDGKLHFEGRIQLQKYMTVDKTEENKNILRNANIDFEEFQGNKLKLSHDSLRKLAIGATVLISPVTAVALMLIPKRTEIKNDMSLNQNQINDLKSGEVIGRYNEKNERILMQLDKNTNNIVTVKTKDIFVPDKLIEQHLTPLQKEQLKNGREIQLKTEDGKTVFAKLDLNEKSGFILKNEKGQKLNIDAYGKRPAKKENKNNMKI
ncbi:DUF3945 domain-containing protein, partial [Bacteroidales bacterium OttesenSCG-928-E04]|nr:DUF3945 domain-containing protein [Bacteroidales bacterium OttesenSCG-928-E04]